jgi:murein DD-endopeptidase MepM/ murein hydrolase activator NlpD
MNYQYPYNNSYGHRKKSEGTYLMKLSKQLAGVLIIMLVLIMFKYVKSGTTDIINNKIKDVISLDYTKQANAVFVSSTPNIKDLWNDFLNKFNISKEFKIDYLPVEGKITSSFGTRVDPITKTTENHEGIDINAKLGTAVKAVYDGTVETVENSKTMGLMLVINHNNNFKTVYGHLSEIKISEGEMVTKGSIVALTGNTGESTGPHLHFEIHKNDKAVNPMDYLNSNP